MIKDPFPETAGIPWSRVMPEILRAAFGTDYLEKLPLLFARGEGYQEIRAKFWELVTDTLIGGFFAPYHAWCQKHGKQFIGHVKGEEHLLFQLPMVGSRHRIFRHLSMPGIDALERYPALDFFRAKPPRPPANSATAAAWSSVSAAPAGEHRPKTLNATCSGSAATASPTSFFT
jgi:hypothetical protein